MATDFAPGSYDFKFVAGNRVRFSLAFLQGTPPAPLDITGVAASLQARGGGVLLLSATTANGMLTLNGSAGTIAVDLPASATQIRPGLYPYDLLLTFPGSPADPETYLSGTLQVLDSVNA